MGTVVAGDVWLLELWEEGDNARALAADLLRCQILTARTRGHVLVLSDTITQRQIRARSRYGRIPNVVVPCLACGWAAFLINWVAATDISVAEGERLFVERAEVMPINDLRYLLCCDPEEYSEGVLETLERYRIT